MDKIKFFDIIDDPEYYETEKDGKAFFVCATEGFIPKSKIDKTNKKMDIHCVCGDVIVVAMFTNKELELMIKDKLESLESLKFSRMAEEAMLW